MSQKLCYVLPKYDPDSEEHFHHIYGFLELLACSVDVFLIVERATRRPILRGIRHIRVPHRWFPLRAIEMLISVLEARLRGYRIFYVHYSYVGAVTATVIARVLGGRVFYWNCGLATMFFQPWAMSKTALTAKFTSELPLRLALRITHHLVTGTPGMAEYYTRELSVPRDRIVVLPNEIDLQRFAHVPSRSAVRRRLRCEDREVILFLHRLAPRTGADLLPEIIRQIVSIRPQIIFLIAGGGPSRRYIEHEIHLRGLDPHVRFVGWVPNRLVFDFYTAADLYIMPSLAAGFPRVLLEAMATGTPFVATDVGGVREICPEGQERWLVPPNDPQAFARAVIDYLSRVHERKAQAIRGLAHVKQFDLPRVVAQFEERIMNASR